MNYQKPILTLSFLSILLLSFTPGKKTLSYDDYPVYSGSDLGVKYSPLKTVFKIWAPTASAVKLRLYEAGDGGKATQIIKLNKAEQGVWDITLNHDLKNQYY